MDSAVQLSSSVQRFWRLCPVHLAPLSNSFGGRVQLPGCMERDGQDRLPTLFQRHFACLEGPRWRCTLAISIRKIPGPQSHLVALVVKDLHCSKLRATV